MSHVGHTVPNLLAGMGSGRVDKRSASTIIGYRWMRYAYPPYDYDSNEPLQSFQQHALVERGLGDIGVGARLQPAPLVLV